MDSGSAHSAEIDAPALGGIHDLKPRFLELSGLSPDEFWRDADAGSVGLTKDELAEALIAIGVKYNFGVAPGFPPMQRDVAAFWRALQLQDLALAHACALGRDVAWRQFMTRFRTPLTQAAIGITGSAEAGRELADSLYAEMFGLSERNGQRRSPLASYSGRGSLKGFLRATLAQRNVDRHRRTHRETQLVAGDFPAAPAMPTPGAHVLSHLREALTQALGVLGAEERFLLSAWYLDRRTLLEISRVIGVHEATASRRLQRLTAKLHDELLTRLRAAGMSEAAAHEAVGIDPGDLDINLRSLLQASQPATFREQGITASPDRT